MITNIVSENHGDEINGSQERERLPRDVFVIAQEIKMIKSLAGNDPKQREKQLRKLGKWFNIRSKSSFAFTDEDFLRIWKGLYYCMWMSDKPLVQESLADNLGKLVDCFENTPVSIQFFGAFLKTMSLEWFGIDQWRMDKFLMLIRKMFRYIFYAMHKENWSISCVKQFNQQLTANVFEGDEIGGLIMHVADIFLEELAKVAQENISGDSVAELIKPFVTFLAKQHDFKLMDYIKNRIFFHWLWQSERGREYNEKFIAWKEMGFPTSSINEIEKIEESEEDQEIEKDENEILLDPRAGNVDVFVPQLEVNASPIVKFIETIQFKDITNTKSRKMLRIILEKYKAYEAGNFPLGIRRIPKPELEPMKELIENKIDNLQELEKELYSTTRNLKKLSKKKRKRLLASINFDNVKDGDFEEVLKTALQQESYKRPQNGSANWIEEDIEVSISPSKKRKLENSGKDDKCKDKNKIKKNKKLLNKEKKSNKSHAWLESIPTQNSTNNIDVETVKENINTQKIKKNSISNSQQFEWEKPLQDGEVEYFVPSRKLKLKEANESFSSNQNIVLNPFAKKNKKKLANEKNILLGKATQINKKQIQKKDLNQTYPTAIASKRKRVKIVLDKNMFQKPTDYIQQVRSSPQLPHDPQKQPKKSLLKPNLLPSPINPFYQKKIGLKLDKTL